jgi:hypothetical protein
MPSLEAHIDRLAGATRWTYRASERSSSEPAAWAALALLAHGRVDDALAPGQWLASLQQTGGSIGVSETEPDPCWPTSLALWAWIAIDRIRQEQRFKRHIEAATAWSLADHGKSAPRSPQIGHDTELVGWSWAAATHSWLEPTCFFLLALRAAGLNDHPRVREGLRLVVDRLLPDGGANYGNTIVLGQALAPHVQPTGAAMLAIAGEQLSDPRIGKSLDYLERSVGPAMAPASLSFACLGLTAHGRPRGASHSWLAAALNETKRGPIAVYEQALLLLAAAPLEQLLGTRVGVLN